MAMVLFNGGSEQNAAIVLIIQLYKYIFYYVKIITIKGMHQSI